MMNVDTEKEAYASVTQVVYKAVFEGVQAFREISKEQAEKRHFEEAMREQAVREKAAEVKRAIEEKAKLNTATPSVILDVNAVDFEAPAALIANNGAPKHTVDMLA